MEKHLLIIGGSGFIGQAICHQASQKGIPVISLSRSGKPLKGHFKREDLITWVKTDLFTETDWHQYLAPSYAVINLIGVLRETQEHSYHQMIITANHIISQEVSNYPHIKYLFLSANSGPKKYLLSKRQAEQSLSFLTNPVVIFRPGLVVGKGRFMSIFEGLALEILGRLPFIKPLFLPLQPIRVTTLATIIIEKSFNETSEILSLKELKN